MRRTHTGPRAPSDGNRRIVEREWQAASFRLAHEPTLSRLPCRAAAPARFRLSGAHETAIEWRRAAAAGEKHTTVAERGEADANRANKRNENIVCVGRLIRFFSLVSIRVSRGIHTFRFSLTVCCVIFQILFSVPFSTDLICSVSHSPEQQNRGTKSASRKKTTEISCWLRILLFSFSSLRGWGLVRASRVYYCYLHSGVAATEIDTAEKENDARLFRFGFSSIFFATCSWKE